MRRSGIILVLIVSAISAARLLAHHSMAAEFDDKKSINFKGMVTKFDWTNPHVYAFVDVTDPRGTTNWAIEMGSRPEMKRLGWTGESLKIGDVVTVDGYAARDGSNRLEGRTITLATGKKLNANTTGAELRAGSGASKPMPRWPDGHLNLSAEVGYWAYPSSSSLTENPVKMNRDGLLANISDAGKVAPFQPWAKALYEYRQKNSLKDDPMAVCLPPGGPRQFQIPYGFQFLDQPDRKRIFIMSGGGNRNWRMIPMDGRKLPSIDDVSGEYYGYSSGKWDGDTLVIDTIGFNERFWFSNGGLPHTENLKLHETLLRQDYSTLKYTVTIDDVGAYTRPWTSSWTLQWVPGQDIEEYFCDEYNKYEDPEHK